MYDVSQTVSKNIFQGTKQEHTKSLNELLSGVTSIDDGVNNLQSGISKLEKLVSLGEEYKTVNNESIESEDEKNKKHFLSRITKGYLRFNVKYPFYY